MPNGGALFTMSYYGAEKVIEHYNIMGPVKAALESVTRYLAADLGPKGIRVNTLSPGGVLAGQDEQFKTKYGARVPLRRMAEAEDLKGPLVFLASRASSYVTGHELRVEGGFTAW